MKKKKKTSFYYYLFPTLLSDKLFILNAELYKTSPPFYKEIETIDMKIVNKSYLKFIQNIQTLKNSESENDLYLCYLIIWSLTRWYTEEKEREYRFYEMLNMLKKIEEHEIKIFQIIFQNLLEFNEDKNIILLYKIFINLRLNPSWEMFSLVSKIIKKKQNASNKKNLLHQDIDPQELINKYQINKNIDNFHQRSLKVEESDDTIFSNALTFYAYFKCEKCKTSINICDICGNLSSIILDKDKHGHERLKCKTKFKNSKICDGIYEPKLKFRFGEELFNQKEIYNLMYKRKSSMLKEAKLLFPSELKQQLLQIVSNIQKKDKFDVELFKYNYPNVYWSLIFYFDLNNINKTFMLTYINFDANTILENIKSENIEYVKSKKEENENEENKIFNIDLKITKNFKFQNFFLQDNKNEIKKYDTENLCIQNVYDLGLINNILYSYKKIFSYEENIGYNELPLIIFESESFMLSSQRSSAIIYNDNDDPNNNFVVRDSIMPFNKRNSDGNINYNMNLRISQAEAPIDNHSLIKKRNPMEDHIFDFESSDDDNEDNNMEGDSEPVFSSCKTNYV